jgi:hypothetical protein
VLSEPTNDSLDGLDREERLFADDPASYFDHSATKMHSLPRDQLDALQRTALARRFAELRDRIPVLAVMARDQGVERLAEIEDVVPLLFEHTVYKSFPPALIERGRFDDLTRWLDRLSIHDLSEVSVDGCSTLDSWFETLDAQTPLRVTHSSGTTGSMSFLPRSQPEWDLLGKTFRVGALGSVVGEDHSDSRFDVIWPTYRSGYTGMLRGADGLVRHLAGGEERFHAMDAGRMSADVMFFAGRLRAAVARGEVDSLHQLSPELSSRRAEFEATQRMLSECMPRFFEQVVANLQGRRVFVIATWNVMFEFATAGIDRGLRDVFAPDSSIWVGGGAKGQVVPPGWETTVEAFTGVPRLQHVYGMSEVMGVQFLCACERYHIQPWVIPYVLDPDTGEPRPREGIRTGRAAFFDLMAHTYWGGFITGDEVTIDWDPCPCGRTTPHVAKAINRYSDLRGGDDKITCAASADAHRDALEYLTAEIG